MIHFLCYLMMSEFCNRAELNSQWISTLQRGSNEEVYSTRQSLYGEPLLRTGIWGADNIIGRRQ